MKNETFNITEINGGKHIVYEGTLKDYGIYFKWKDICGRNQEFPKSLTSLIAVLNNHFCNETGGFRFYSFSTAGEVARAILSKIHNINNSYEFRDIRVKKQKEKKKCLP